MYADTHGIGADRRSDQRPKRRRRLVPRQRLDGRTRIAKRAKQLAAHFLEALGDREITLELEAAVRRVGELIAIAEQLRADKLRGLPVPADDIVRTDRLANLALRQLGLPKAKPAEAESLSAYLADRYDKDGA
jgi:hypothetical protein